LKETITRSITGILFLLVIVLALILHPYLYLAIFSLVCFAGWLEFTSLFYQKSKPGIKIPGGLLLTGSFIIIYFIFNGQLPGYFMFIPAISLLVMIIIDATFKTHLAGIGIPVCTTGFIYMGAGMFCLHCLAFQQGTLEAYSPAWILYVCSLIWIYDTMAYVCGKLFGRHTIWKRISPGKTWEGAIGGLVFLMLLAWFFARLVPDLGILEWCIFGVIASVTGTMGDFLESWMKRKAGLKDSGRILPGHGGMLDRIDSLLLSTPFLTLYLYLVL
jgi:phosphatidate cytidylyltransferase